MNSPLREVPSPCINVCQMDPATGYCRGCLRTIEEIADWLELSNEKKLQVLQRLEERRKRST